MKTFKFLTLSLLVATTGLYNEANCIMMYDNYKLPKKQEREIIKYFNEDKTKTVKDIAEYFKVLRSKVVELLSVTESIKVTHEKLLKYTILFLKDNHMFLNKNDCFVYTKATYKYMDAEEIILTFSALLDDIRKTLNNNKFSEEQLKYLAYRLDWLFIIADLLELEGIKLTPDEKDKVKYLEQNDQTLTSTAEHFGIPKRKILEFYLRESKVARLVYKMFHKHDIKYYEMEDLLRCVEKDLKKYYNKEIKVTKADINNILFKLEEHL